MDINNKILIDYIYKNLDQQQEIQLNTIIENEVAVRDLIDTLMDIAFTNNFSSNELEEYLMDLDITNLYMEFRNPLILVENNIQNSIMEDMVVHKITTPVLNSKINTSKNNFRIDTIKFIKAKMIKLELINIAAGLLILSLTILYFSNKTANLKKTIAVNNTKIDSLTNQQEFIQEYQIKSYQNISIPELNDTIHINHLSRNSISEGHDATSLVSRSWMLENTFSINVELEKQVNLFKRSPTKNFKIIYPEESNQHYAKFEPVIFSWDYSLATKLTIVNSTFDTLYRGDYKPGKIDTIKILNGRVGLFYYKIESENGLIFIDKIIIGDKKYIAGDDHEPFPK